jgi:hypothetical protein
VIEYFVLRAESAFLVKRTEGASLEEFRREKTLAENAKGYKRAALALKDGLAEIDLREQAPFKRSEGKFNPRRGYLVAYYGDIPEKKQVHAEMRVLDLLWAGILLPYESKAPLRVGVSLLCCADCTNAIALFNQKVASDLGIAQIEVGGSHQGSSIAWHPPGWIRGEELDFAPAGKSELENATFTPITFVVPT